MILDKDFFPQIIDFCKSISQSTQPISKLPLVQSFGFLDSLKYMHDLLLYQKEYEKSKLTKIYLDTFKAKSRKYATY